MNNLISKSLHRANIIFVFDEQKFLAPDNSLIATLYSGDVGQAARFIDDPILRTKIFDIPKLKIQIIIEQNRLRIEDLSQQEPEHSLLIVEAIKIYKNIFSQFPVKAIGFNYDVYCRFENVINLENAFLQFIDKRVLDQNDLKDFGVQFTIAKPKERKQETYFVKITAPLEIAMHINHHFNHIKKEEVEEKKLCNLFQKCYYGIEEMTNNLKF